MIYVDLHLNPSAGAVIVLTPGLTVRKRLYGSTALLLPDGRLLYRNSMIHFAPAHPGSVSLYDPRINSDVRVYPAKPDQMTGPRLIDRSILKLERVAANRIRISAREQGVVVGRDNRGRPSGPAVEKVVTCDIPSLTPRCTVRTKQAARQM